MNHVLAGDGLRWSAMVCDGLRWSAMGSAMGSAMICDGVANQPTGFIARDAQNLVARICKLVANWLLGFGDAQNLVWD